MHLPARLRVSETLSDGRVWGVWIGALAFFVGAAVVDALSSQERASLQTAVFFALVSALSTLDVSAGPALPGASSRALVGGAFVALALPLWSWTQTAPAWGEIARVGGVGLLTAFQWAAIAARFPNAAWLTALAPCLVLASRVEGLSALRLVSPTGAVEHDGHLAFFVVVSVVLPLVFRFGRAPDFPMSNARH